MSDRQMQELEQERMTHVLEILRRAMWHQTTSADLLFLALELGVSKQFEQDIQQKEAA